MLQQLLRKLAGGQVGRSVIGLQNQYNQQYLANLSNRQITRGYRIADKLRAGEALNAARENTSNQVQFYTPQPVADPVKPMAPLPIQAVPANSRWLVLVLPTLHGQDWEPLVWNRI
jgi:hypothetical protein